jgi:hypothetical protein
MLPNWTDSIIHWNQLGSTATKRLIDTWGKDEAFIRKYDAKHGHVHVPATASVPAKSAAKTEATTPAKAVKKATTAAPKKAPVRQKHTGANGEIKFVEHRNLFIGFWDNKVVVTKRTEAQCREFLKKEYGAE